MKTKGQKGFTLIELMIVGFIGAIVVLATGMVLFTSQTFWNKAWEKANLQREASYAMVRMSRVIKAGRLAELEENGRAIKIYNEADWEGFSCVEGTNDLQYHPPGGAQSETIINDNVENLQFNVEGNMVTTTLKLEKDNLQTALVSTVMMRNYGG